MSDKQYNGYIEDDDNDTNSTDNGSVDEETGEINADEDAGETLPAVSEYGGYYPTCRFCGKQSLPFDNYKSQADADEAATLRCDCAEARQYQEEVKRQKQRAMNIEKLKLKLSDFGEYLSARHVELTDELYNYLLLSGISVLDGVIAKATIKLSRIQTNITTNSKGNIVIDFKYSDAAKVEI